jgi:acetyl-CoA acetyltransferase family protein
LESNRRALAARERLADEICPAFPSNGNHRKVGQFLRQASTHPAQNSTNGSETSGQLAITKDNGPREQQSLEALAKLKPVFDRRNGTVTAGNASQVTDGAVALLVMSEERAAELDFEPLGVLAGYAYAGCDPSRMGLGPIFALARAEAETGLTLADADLVELNEAFAAQALAVIKAAKSEAFARKFLSREASLGEISAEKLNINGGAIALGHPVGATGARLVLTSLKELQRRKAKRAVVTLCVVGGQGAALWLERL